MILQYSEALFEEEILEATKLSTACNFFATQPAGSKEHNVQFMTGDTVVERALNESDRQIWFASGSLGTQRTNHASNLEPYNSVANGLRISPRY